MEDLQLDGPINITSTVIHAEVGSMDSVVVQAAAPTWTSSYTGNGGDTFVVSDRGTEVVGDELLVYVVQPIVVV